MSSAQYFVLDTGYRWLAIAGVASVAFSAFTLIAAHIERKNRK